MNAPAPTKPNRLMRQMLLLARLQWVCLAAMIFAAGSFYALVYRPQDQELQALNGQIELKKEELSSDKSRTDKLPAVTGELAALTRRLAGFKKLPRDPQYGDFVMDINLAKGRSALTNLDIEPKTPKRGDLYSEQPIVLTFNGSFVDVQTFISQIESLDRLTRLRDVEVKSMEGHDGTVSVTLSINIYYSGGS
jgi:Tfp pilus assembly protein PilO